MTASEVAAATEIQVGSAKLTAGAPAGARRSPYGAVPMGRWLTAALTINAMATAIWVLSAFANRINQHNAEAMRLGQY